MPRYLIEVSQRSSTLARQRIRNAVDAMGSHFATHARWVRKDGVCSGSLVVDSGDSRGARGIVPPSMRNDARIVRLESEAA
jgi:hypothetical protein